MSNNNIEVSTQVYTQVNVRQNESSSQLGMVFALLAAAIPLALGAALVVGLAVALPLVVDLLINYGLYAIGALVILLAIKTPWIAKAVLGVAFAGSVAYAGLFVWSFYRAETILVAQWVAVIAASIAGLVLLPRIVSFVLDAVGALRITRRSAAAVTIVGDGEASYAWDMGSIKVKQEVNRERNG